MIMSTTLWVCLYSGVKGDSLLPLAPDYTPAGVYRYDANRVYRLQPGSLASPVFVRGSSSTNACEILFADQIVAETGVPNSGSPDGLAVGPDNQESSHGESVHGQEPGSSDGLPIHPEGQESSRREPGYEQMIRVHDDGDEIEIVEEEPTTGLDGSSDALNPVKDEGQITSSVISAWARYRGSSWTASFLCIDVRAKTQSIQRAQQSLGTRTPHCTSHNRYKSLGMWAIQCPPERFAEIVPSDHPWFSGNQNFQPLCLPTLESMVRSTRSDLKLQARCVPYVRALKQSVRNTIGDCLTSLATINLQIDPKQHSFHRPRVQVWLQRAEANSRPRPVHDLIEGEYIEMYDVTSEDSKDYRQVYKENRISAVTLEVDTNHKYMACTRVADKDSPFSSSLTLNIAQLMSY